MDQTDGQKERHEVRHRVAHVGEQKRRAVAEKSPRRPHDQRPLREVPQLLHEPVVRHPPIERRWLPVLRELRQCDEHQLLPVRRRVHRPQPPQLSQQELVARSRLGPHLARPDCLRPLLKERPQVVDDLEQEPLELEQAQQVKLQPPRLLALPHAALVL